MEVATAVMSVLCLAIGIANYLINLIRLIKHRRRTQRENELAIGWMKIFGLMTGFMLFTLLVAQTIQRINPANYKGNTLIVLIISCLMFMALLVAMVIAHEENKWAP